MKYLILMMVLLNFACAHKKPASKDNFLSMAEFYFKQENHARSRFYYTAALEKANEKKDENKEEKFLILSQLGVLSIKLNQYEEARDYFLKSQVINNDQTTLYNLALVNLLLNQPQKSFEYLEQLKGSDDVAVTKLLIIAFMQVSDFAQSLNLFEKLPASVRKNGDIHPYYVYTLIQMNKLEEADYQMINVKDLQVAKRIMKILKPKLASK